MSILVIGVLSYLLGSIPTGLWLGQLWKGIDVREQGSGNLGATNVFRILGPGPGIITLLLDIAKGAAPVLAVLRHDPGNFALALMAGLCAIVGHTMSLFVKFRGGKGVATSAGVFAALMPLSAAIAIGIFLISLAATRMVSASSILAALGLAVSSFFFAPDPRLAYPTCAVACLVIWKHRSNIQRILAGTESRMGAKGGA
jgi:glycerol-3-phosphate acyltransferase PlsY